MTEPKQREKRDYTEHTTWSGLLAKGGLGQFAPNLQARVLADGRIRLYYQWKPAKGAPAERWPFGWAATGKTQTSEESLHFTVAGAKRYVLATVAPLAAQARARGMTIAQMLEDERATERARQDAAQAAADAAKQAADDARRYSLGNLLKAYCSELEAKGKHSAASVRKAIRRHVLERHAALCERPASSLTRDDLLPVVVDLADKGKARMAGLVKSYLQAAYQRGIDAAGDADALPALRGFKLQVNPAKAIKARPAAARERALGMQEVHAYLEAVEALASPVTRSALMLGLLLGGQRMSQLLRVTAADVDLEERRIKLRDPKGRRIKARVHELPLTDRTAALLRELIGWAPPGAPLFSADGERQTTIWTVSAAVRDIARTLVAEGTCATPFCLADIRRTCESRLFDMGISRDVRGLIQSHGLGGVQAVHYERPDLDKVVRPVLERWEAALYPTKAAVVALPVRA